MSAPVLSILNIDKILT